MVWNKGLTKDTDERVKQYSKSIRRSKKIKPPWNKGLTRDTDERVKQNGENTGISLKNKPGHSVSNKTKEKLSEARSKIIEERGIGGFKDVKWYKIKNINKEEYILRGTWEVIVAKWLNRNKIIWKRKVYLKYKDNNGIKRTYTPDFYLPEYDRYIEVKGYYSQLDKEKMKLVKEQNNIKLLFLFSKHIKKLNAGDSNSGIGTCLISRV